MSKPLWSGRLATGLDPRVRAFTASLDLDRVIARHDVRGSIAHARMLGRQRIVAAADAEGIVAALLTIDAELAAGTFPWPDDAEDVHSAVEQVLTTRIGPVAGRLHSARSRNDQVALDLRLFTLDALDALDRALVTVGRALIARAGDEIDTVMPGYTHLQRAQPVSLAHHLLAHVEAFRRDRARVADARLRTAVSPLGAAALAGTPHPVDPASVAKELGLAGTFRNSIDAVADRDFIAEFVFVAALAAVHASRLAEELVLWTGSEFGFAAFSDAHATGSSIMPQKKNPDVAELVRGRSGRIIGDLVAVLTALKGLPLAYGGDLQEQRVPLYDATTVAPALETLALVVDGLTFDRASMRRATERGMLAATDLADHLTRQGVPFREAHEIVGRIVSERLAAGEDLAGLTLAQLRAHDRRFGDDAAAETGIDRSLGARTSPGGTAPVRVREALAEARSAFDR
ncbi:MAG TPA: argininosuccinate lyase [Candidatus Saccharimonadales bacterium]|nr:argininosuccinate lyase [Candidatus Saccharimonadales bacterium]